MFHADANHTIGPAFGDRFDFAPVTTLRTITLQQTAPNTPDDGEIVECVYNVQLGAGITGQSLVFIREGSGVIVATFYGDAAQGFSVTAQFEYVAASNGWRLGMNSGKDTISSVTRGVDPGAGA